MSGNLIAAAPLLKQRVRDAVHGMRGTLGEVILRLDGFAEVGGEERESSAYLGGLLREAGFSLDDGVAGLPTAFRAVGSSTEDAASIAFLLEYDALPAIGHGCGHDASAAASVGAALALNTCLAETGTPGRVVAIGTPGEENLSCKIEMVRRGVFADIDAAMMVHAFDRWLLAVDTMALDAREYTFLGQAAHAAAAPEKGVNALDAVALTFHAVNCLRQHIPDACRVHGVITNGGEVPNVVPERSEARFYVRAPRRRQLDELTPRIDRCAEGAGLATGCRLSAESFESSVDDILLNRPLLELFEANLRGLDPPVDIDEGKVPLGSTDVGNLSYVVPTIHPLGGFAPLGTVLHTRDFAEAMLTDRALDGVCAAAAALAETAVDLIVDPEALTRSRRVLAASE